MKTTAHLKTIYIIILFLLTTVVFAQDSIRLFEPLPRNSEKINLIQPKGAIIWGNSDKYTLENYGAAKVKNGITSTGTNRKRGVYYSVVKQKITINLTTFNNMTSTLKVQTVQNEEYTLKDTSFENALLNIAGTGVETEEVQSYAPFEKTIRGSITTSSEISKNWDINLIIDKTPSLFLELGNLTNGNQTIKIIRTNLDDNKNINENGNIPEATQFYELLENGISLGAVTTKNYNGDNSIWLKPGLDASTKLILCSALLLLKKF
ncbi:hypothetical protein [Aestuariivivens insulae]|uniref:hypothetical protein n=1 Tax=Aestuariivivens insulae TaxID=1621988 RepID=UPI001F56B907|nr:hypothetical protein [Aestuariivivens insulae]